MLRDRLPNYPVGKMSGMEELKWDFSATDRHGHRIGIYIACGWGG